MIHAFQKWRPTVLPCQKWLAVVESVQKLPVEEEAMAGMFSSHLSADALSEVRRKVHQTRKDAALPIGEVVTAEIISHDVRVIAEFIAEEFEDDVVELFRSRVAPNPWPEITSWDYPGPWVNAHSETLVHILDSEASVNIFSKSGSYTLRISALD
jgi:hypothetical protein